MSHYFEPPTDTLTTTPLQIEFDGMLCSFTLPSGVFAKNKLDRGTEVLLRHAQIPEGSKLLDMGCGWGPLGILLAKTHACPVTMVDVNPRAVAFAQKNAQRNHVEATVILSHVYEQVQETFDVIVSNLPQHAGKDVCFAIIEGAKKYLTPKGSLQVVIRRNKGGASVATKMKEVFGNCTLVAKKSGYGVYCSMMPSQT